MTCHGRAMRVMANGFHRTSQRPTNKAGAEYGVAGRSFLRMGKTSLT